MPMLPKRASDLTGQRFGRLTALEYVTSKPRFKWRCRCDCGVETTVTTSNLREGHTKSCGCLQRELASARRTTHGQSKVGERTAMYQLWCGIRQRTITQTKGLGYDRYKARGIGMYQAWADSFQEFYKWINEHLGERPEGHSLDRINNNGGYEPGNLKWSTHPEQCNNRESCVIITHNGEARTVTQWAEFAGLNTITLWCRLFKYHWPVDKALTLKPKPGGNHHD